MSDTSDFVSAFYGQEIQKTEDLSMSACCTLDYDPALLVPITDEVKARRYGCGSPLPPALAGMTVLDLGCGAGIDCYIAAQLVGPTGRVIGVDMTSEQLTVARENLAPIMANLGYDQPNVSFIEARIEALPLEDCSVDVVISNCVINLVEDKAAVFDEIWRVLRPGGELYIADIVSDRRIPARLAADELLYSECLTGAAYDGDLRRIMAKSGFLDPRTIKTRALVEVIEGIRFESRDLRAFKLPLEDACEDYGQVAIYRGTLPDHPAGYTFDGGHVFAAGRAVRVCKNTADMLTATRYAPHFDVTAPLYHLGIFDCSPIAEQPPGATPAGCC